TKREHLAAPVSCGTGGIHGHLERLLRLCQATQPVLEETDVLARLSEGLVLPRLLQVGEYRAELVKEGLEWSRRQARAERHLSDRHEGHQALVARGPRRSGGLPQPRGLVMGATREPER